MVTLHSLTNVMRAGNRVVRIIRKLSTSNDVLPKSSYFRTGGYSDDGRGGRIAIVACKSTITNVGNGLLSKVLGKSREKVRRTPTLLELGARKPVNSP